MTTIRIQHNRDYTVVANAAIQDNRLTLAARGLHHLLLSYPDNWEINVKHLVKINIEGRDKIYGLIKELELLGYLERNEFRGDGGKFGGSAFLLHELPITDFPDTVSPLTEKPDTGLPDTGLPDTVLPDTYKVINSTSTESKKVLTQQASAGKNFQQGQANSKLPVCCPENAEDLGQTNNPNTGSERTPLRVLPTLEERQAKMSGLSAKRTDHAAIAQQHVSLIKPDEEKGFFEWATEFLEKDGDRQPAKSADIALRCLRSGHKATPLDQSLLEKYRKHLESATNQPQESGFVSPFDSLVVEYQKDPSIASLPHEEFKARFGMSIHKFFEKYSESVA